MGFKSIQTKYIVLVLSCVVISALLIGGVCIRSAAVTASEEAAKRMNLTCESYMYKYDASLKDVQEAVESTARFATQNLDSIQRFSSDEAYRDSYAMLLEEAMELETMSASNVMSYYVRFSPDLLSFEKGFRFVRSGADRTFQQVQIIKVEDYQESDSEHVGWYYKPIENGTTTWLEPYYNANLDTQMISCVSPFYKNGDLVGVIGMDINFSTLVNDLDDLRIFDNGYAFLCSADGYIYYHPLYDSGTYIQEDVSGFDAQLGNESSGSVLYGGVSAGEQVEYAFRTLATGMKLVLRAPLSEINADVIRMTQMIGVLVLGIVVIFTIITVLVCRRITKPLLQITEAADMIAHGHYDVNLDVKTKDEVGTLAHTLQMATVELKASSERMQQLAYKDSLTGVRNKASYDLETSVLNSHIKNGHATFGIAVFDVNNLKIANDVYGHEQGDKVIKTGCNRICMAFPHSPVFRIGGDEFVLILHENELPHIDERLDEFARRAEAENSAVQNPQDVVNVSVGVAVFDPKTDTCVQDVFNRADGLMYQMKHAMKQEQGQKRPS